MGATDYTNRLLSLVCVVRIDGDAMIFCVETVGYPDGSFHFTFSHHIDSDTWTVAYERGYRAPNYPVPVTLDVADISIAWACMSRCQCSVCVEHYMDSLETDFPDAFLD